MRIVGLMGLICVLLMGLGGCGDDGPTTGVLTDSPVSGVTYEAETHSGVTNAAGRFAYAEGETVTFRIGDTILGQSVGKDVVSPFDLVGTEIPVGDDIRISLRSPFTTVINIAVFLQTLDYDGDAENGIEIRPEVAALFDGVEIPFDHTPNWFHTLVEFREVLADINDMELLATIRDVRSPDLAIQHLYEQLGVDPEIFTSSYREQDDNADEIPERITTLEFDEYGHEIRRETDEDGDGDTDAISFQTWNDNGQPLGDEYDSNADGTIDSRSVCIYDEFGNHIRSENDSNADETPESVRTWEYDRLGRIVRRLEDSDADDNPDVVTEYVYDGNTTRFETDNGADGSIDSVTTSERNEYGFRIRTTQDSNNDGSPERIFETEYDDAGRITRSEEDTDGDGTPNTVRVTTYDEDGRRLRTEQDLNGDNVVDRIERWTYVGEELTTYENDTNADETPEAITTYLYDDEGNQNRVEVRELGVLTRVETREFDDDGNITRREYDDDADDTPDRIEIREWVRVNFAWEFDF